MADDGERGGERGEGTHLQLVDGYPTGAGGVLEEDGDEPLHTSVPVAEEEHETHEVEDSHELAGHLQELHRTHNKTAT